MKSKHHVIRLEDLQEWLAAEELTFASSTRERKRLVCTTKGTLKVYVAGSLVWQGMQPYSAVEAYNAITETYVDPIKDFKL
jgi:predicted Rdx family selenoprotein